jgi:hypothetical protein
MAGPIDWLAVLRVRVNARSNRPAKPYGPLVLDTRTADSEAYLGPAVNALENAVCKTWGYNLCPNQITLVDGQSEPSTRLARNAEGTA